MERVVEMYRGLRADADREVQTNSSY